MAGAAADPLGQRRGPAGLTGRRHGLRPAATLTEFSGLERLDVGDLLLTGTPGGVALQPPPALVQRIVGLLPDRRRWELFVRSQSRSGAYLKPGDRIEASIRTADGALDLGTQHNRVR